MLYLLLSLNCRNQNKETSKVFFQTVTIYALKYWSLVRSRFLEVSSRHKTFSDLNHPYLLLLFPQNDWKLSGSMKAIEDMTLDPLTPSTIEGIASKTNFPTFLLHVFSGLMLIEVNAKFKAEKILKRLCILKWIKNKMNLTVLQFLSTAHFREMIPSNMGQAVRTVLQFKTRSNVHMDVVKKILTKHFAGSGHKQATMELSNSNSTFDHFGVRIPLIFAHNFFDPFSPVTRIPLEYVSELKRTSFFYSFISTKETPIGVPHELDIAYHLFQFWLQIRIFFPTRMGDTVVVPAMRNIFGSRQTLLPSINIDYNTSWVSPMPPSSHLESYKPRVQHLKLLDPVRVRYSAYTLSKDSANNYFAFIPQLVSMLSHQEFEGAPSGISRQAWEFLKRTGTVFSRVDQYRHLISTKVVSDTWRALGGKYFYDSLTLGYTIHEIDLHPIVTFLEAFETNRVGTLDIYLCFHVLTILLKREEDVVATLCHFFRGVNCLVSLQNAYKVYRERQLLQYEKLMQSHAGLIIRQSREQWDHYNIPQPSHSDIVRALSKDTLALYFNSCILINSMHKDSTLDMLLGIWQERVNPPATLLDSTLVLFTYKGDNLTLKWREFISFGFELIHNTFFKPCMMVWRTAFPQSLILMSNNETWLDRLSMTNSLPCSTKLVDSILLLSMTSKFQSELKMLVDDKSLPEHEQLPIPKDLSATYVGLLHILSQKVSATNPVVKHLRYLLGGDSATKVLSFFTSKWVGVFKGSLQYRGCILLHDVNAFFSEALHFANSVTPDVLLSKVWFECCHNRPDYTGKIRTFLSTELTNDLMGNKLRGIFEANRVIKLEIDLNKPFFNKI